MLGRFILWCLSEAEVSFRVLIRLSINEFFLENVLKTLHFNFANLPKGLFHKGWKYWGCIPLNHPKTLVELPLSFGWVVEECFPFFTFSNQYIGPTLVAMGTLFFYWSLSYFHNSQELVWDQMGSKGVVCKVSDQHFNRNILSPLYSWRVLVWRNTLLLWINLVGKHLWLIITWILLCFLSHCVTLSGILFLTWIGFM